MRTQAQNKATETYRKKTYDQILIKCRKDSYLYERLEKACTEKHTSKQAYIIKAIETQLQKDGYMQYSPE